ncbi:unnamed protein product [Ambrosiozyma monospora]|uniref:Unnamed protein product n=1 Tax=Ambrosiozyma monospora TaxID=43982 RepID=A0A9W6Z439_AMBMO|nr:unnamed protein product [Ambrosiozyma monospora]
MTSSTPSFLSQELPTIDEHTACTKAAKEIIEQLATWITKSIPQAKYIPHSDQISNNIHILEQWLCEQRQTPLFETVIYMLENTLPEFIPIGKTHVEVAPMVIDDNEPTTETDATKGNEELPSTGIKSGNKILDGDVQIDQQTLIARSPWNDVPAGSTPLPCLIFKPACKSLFYESLTTNFFNLLHLTLNYGVAAREIINDNDISTIFIHNNPRRTLINLRNARSLHPNLTKYLEFYKVAAGKQGHTISLAVNAFTTIMDDLEIAEKDDPYVNSTVMWLNEFHGLLQKLQPEARSKCLVYVNKSYEMVPNTTFYRFSPKVFLDYFNSELIQSKYNLQNRPITPLLEAEQFGHYKRYTAKELEPMLKRPYTAFWFNATNFDNYKSQVYAEKPPTYSKFWMERFAEEHSDEEIAAAKEIIKKKYAERRNKGKSKKNMTFGTNF